MKSYDRLETINLARLSLDPFIPGNDLAINSYFRTIAEVSSTLREVVSRRPAYTELEDCVFYLRRGENGRLESVCILDGGEGDRLFSDARYNTL